MAFYQDPPRLGNQYEEDRVLRSYLSRALPPDVRAAIAPSLSELGALAGGPLYRMQLEDRRNEPVLTQWDAWGHRVDAIEVTRLWKEAARIACDTRRTCHFGFAPWAHAPGSPPPCSSACRARPCPRAGPAS